MRRIGMLFGALAAIACSEREITAPCNTCGTPPLTNYTLSVSNDTSVFVGDVVALRATVTPSAGVVITWSTNNTSVVTLSSNGVVTALTPGLARIQVQANCPNGQVITREIKVTVNAKSVANVSVTIGASSATIFVGDTVSFSAEVNPKSVTQTVLWRSSAPHVAAVSSAGKVAGVAPGIARIIALAVVDTTKRDTVVVTVNARPKVYGIKVTPDSIDLALNENRELIVTVQADPGLSKDYVCRSLSAAYVTVTGKCNVKLIFPLSAGQSVTVEAEAIADRGFRSRARVYMKP